MNIAITGGTGSLGRALVEALLACPNVERLVVLSRDEVKQAQLERDFPDHRLNCFLGDVRDEARCRLAFHGCETVIHTAALKQVQKGARDPWEFIKTNILGTVNVIFAALQAAVERVLVISSDKAVEPTNLYGKTKAVAEDFAVHANTYTIPQGLRVSVLRYGNVFRSRGSVPLQWEEQSARGGPLVLTDPSMTRFLITLSDAVALIQDILPRMDGGEIFVPVLSSARLCDLAAVLHPYTPITYTGVRPGGEKLHEVLVSSDESLRLRRVRIGLYAIYPIFHPWILGDPETDPQEWIFPSSLTSEQSPLTQQELQTWLQKAGWLLPFKHE